MKTAEDYFERHWDNWPVDDLASYDATKVNCVKLMQEYANQQLAEYKQKLKDLFTDNGDTAMWVKEDLHKIIDNL